jgi:phosphoribosylaminoimidazole carboxylase (NCAIR synthetase)
MLTDWAEPHDLPEALDRRRVITAEIEEIQAQLGDKTKEQDAEWRKKAIWALTNRLQELRLVKAWVRENRMMSLTV